MTPKDLAGHTLAVNQLQGLAQLTAQAAIDGVGGDSSKVQFVELPFPQMVDAVKAGRVDAALVVEPFLTSATAGGLHVVTSPLTAVAGLPQTIYISAKSYAADHADVVKKFNTALGKAAAAANKDPQSVRTIGATYTKIPPEVLSKIKLLPYAENAGDVQVMTKVVDLMNKYKALTAQPDMDSLLFKP